MTTADTTDHGTVSEFLDAIADEQQRADARELDRVFQRATSGPGKMWSTAIAGYGTATVEYAGGRTEEWMAVGFSPRAKKFAIYGTGAVTGRDELLAKLGKHTTATACIYIAKLADVDVDVLEELARRSNAGAR